MEKIILLINVQHDHYDTCEVKLVGVNIDMHQRKHKHRQSKTIPLILYGVIKPYLHQ